MTYLLGLLFVMLSVVVAVGGLLLVRRLVPSAFFESLHSDASYTVYNAIALVFGVAVGFAILLVWGELNEAEATTQQEASNVEALYRLAEQLPEPDRGQIQEFSRLYVQIVIEEEWPMMADGQASSRAQSAVEELRGSIQEYEPQTTAESALYSQMLTKSDDLYENRELRLLETKEGVPPFVWVVLVITGILTVVFTYLFDLESPRVHALRVAALTVAVALSLYTVRVVEYPFSGDVQVGPEAFEMVLGRL
jgi:ABC-type multidrug transport system fused ATPase/permease subunit